MAPVANRLNDIEAVKERKRPSKKTKGINKVLYTFMGIITICLGILLYWGLESNTLLIVRNEPFPIRTLRDVPSAGGVVFLEVDYCKSKPKQARVRTSYIDGSREVFLPQSVLNSQTGCQNGEFAVPIPRDLPEGEYRIKFYVTYDVNPLKQNREVTFQSQEVTIGEPED